MTLDGERLRTDPAVAMMLMLTDDVVPDYTQHLVVHRR